MEPYRREGTDHDGNNLQREAGRSRCRGNLYYRLRDKPGEQHLNEVALKLVVRLLSPDTPGDAARVAFGIRIVLQASFDLPVELIELRIGFLERGTGARVRAA